MKNKMVFYPVIRREFGTMRELGEVINRSDSYCKQRMNGKKRFTANERKLIAAYCGIAESEITV